MLARIKKLAFEYEEDTISMRRNLHKYAETGWTVYRTASLVAKTLSGLGYQVFTGSEVIDEEAMMGVPSSLELERHEKRALAQGADPFWLGKMIGGKTGVMGVMDFGKPGPTVGLRFDMDANDLTEAEDEAHRPYNEGFASINKGAMHGCGHDGHTAIGITVARILSQVKDNLSGKVKLLFQPAEEGVRGAKAMMMAGVVDDVDYMLGFHLGFILRKLGQISTDAGGFLATTKLDANFTGKPSHAGLAPEIGKNALLAAATALINLYAIARHGKGTSRINVGIMQGGTGRNVIPANAVLKLETRGITSEINEYMHSAAVRIIKGSAAMHDVKVLLEEMGSAAGTSSDFALGERARRIAKELDLFDEFLPQVDLGGSEDVAYFMSRVQERGGQAAYAIIGTEISAGHHESRFDFNEDALRKAVSYVAGVTTDLLTDS
ncbi:MAG: M20 family metallo-hydrolase [Firmicutes bacterium]|nr:M20 family metallo-hydrolase [Bacillota bacterium]